MPAAWKQGATGANVVIADIDWGFRTSHRELQQNLDKAAAFNSFDGSKHVSQGSFVAHGTAVLGIAGAAGDGLGMAGVAPQAILWPIQADDGTGSLLAPDRWANAIEHVRWADSGGRRKVIILEVETAEKGGNYEQVPSVNAAIRRAIAAGIVVCVAAGNGNQAADLADDDGKPIEPTGSILVGATSWHPTENRRAEFSNWGPRIVVSAPGDGEHDLTCADTADDAYTSKFGGTSGAAPKVAGVAALMLSVNPTLSPADVREILRGTGTKISPEVEPNGAQGKPIGVFVNAEAAVRAAIVRPGNIVPAAQAGTYMQPPVHVEGLTRQVPRQQPATMEPLAAAAGSQSRPHRRTARCANSAQVPPGSCRTTISCWQSIKRSCCSICFTFTGPSKRRSTPSGPSSGCASSGATWKRSQTAGSRSELQFHKLMTSVFMSVRDLHTNYLLPEPYRDYTAYLPCLVRPYYDGDGRRRYIVTDLMPGYPFSNPKFTRGVEILDWNGVAIDDAVDLNAQQTAGSNDRGAFCARCGCARAAPHECRPAT